MFDGKHIFRLFWNGLIIIRQFFSQFFWYYPSEEINRGFLAITILFDLDNSAQPNLASPDPQQPQPRPRHKLGKIWHHNKCCVYRFYKYVCITHPEQNSPLWQWMFYLEIVWSFKEVFTDYHPKKAHQVQDSSLWQGMFNLEIVWSFYFKIITLKRQRAFSAKILSSWFFIALVTFSVFEQSSL